MSKLRQNARRRTTYLIRLSYSDFDWITDQAAALNMTKNDWVLKALKLGAPRVREEVRIAAEFAAIEPEPAPIFGAAGVIKGKR